jgi:hypothetical protein
LPGRVKSCVEAEGVDFSGWIQALLFRCELGRLDASFSLASETGSRRCNFRAVPAKADGADSGEVVVEVAADAYTQRGVTMERGGLTWSLLTMVNQAEMERESETQAP